MYLNIAWFPLDFNMCGENALIIYSSTCTLHVNQNSKYNNGKCIQYKNFIYRSWYINIFLKEYRNVSPHFLVAIHSSSVHSILKCSYKCWTHKLIVHTYALYYIYNTILLNCFSIFWHLKNGIQNCVFGNITKRITH